MPHLNDDQRTHSIPGDALISASGIEHSAFLLSNDSRELLLEEPGSVPQLLSSLAYLLESLVLHDRLFCAMRESDLAGLLSDLGRPDLGEIIRPLPPGALRERLSSRHPRNFASFIERILYAGWPRPSIGETVLHIKMALLMNQLLWELRTQHTLGKTFRPPYEGRKSELRRSVVQYTTRLGRDYVEMVAALAMQMAYSPLPQPAPTGTAGLDAGAGPYSLFARQVLNTVRSYAQVKITEVNEWLGHEHFRVEAPLVFSLVMAKANAKTDLLSQALSLRESKPAVAFRARCALFASAIAEQDDRAVLQLIEEIKRKAESLTRGVGAPLLGHRHRVSSVGLLQSRRDQAVSGRKEETSPGICQPALRRSASIWGCL